MKFERYAVNGMLNNLLPNFRLIGEAVASPQRKVTRIVKSFTNGCYPIPVTYLELECGHHTGAILIDARDYNRAHDESNHMAKPGAELGCRECRHYADALAKLRALKPGDVQHSRFRTRDSRGFGKGDLYVYGRDPRSPTGVHLLMSIDATPEADEILRKLSASPLSPTEAR